jgi:hypothetical protein
MCWRHRHGCVITIGSVDESFQFEHRRVDQQAGLILALADPPLEHRATAVEALDHVLHLVGRAGEHQREIADLRAL